MKIFKTGGSFYKRLFFTYLIVIGTFVVLSPLVTQYACSLIRKNEQSYAESSIIYVKERFDKEVSTLKETARVILSMEKEYYKRYYSNKTMNDISIVERLGNLVSSYEGLENCFIYDGDQNKLYSVNGSENVSTLLEYQPIDGRDLLSVFADRKGFYFVPITFTNGGKSVVLVASDAFESRNIHVIMPLESNWIGRIYEDNYHTNILMVANESGMVLLSNLNERLHTVLDEDVFARHDKDTPFFYQDKNYYTLLKSSETDWYYVIETDKKQIDLTASKIQFVQIMALVATCLFVFFLVFHLAKWVYSPVNKLIRRFPKSETADEFVSVEAAFAQLNTENEKYRKEASYLHLFNQFDAESAGLSFENEPSYGLVIRGFNIKLYMKELNSIVAGTHPNHFKFFVIEDNEIVGLAREAGGISEVSVVLLRIKEHFYNTYALNLLFGIGNLFTESGEFSRSLQNARYAIDYSSGNKELFIFGDKINVNCSIDIDKNYIENCLFKAVEKNNIDMIQRTISQVFDDNADIPNIFKFGLSIILVNIYSTIGARTKSYVIEYELLIRELKNEYDNGFLRAFFVQLFAGMILEQNHTDGDQEKKELIVRCIEQNYSDINFDLNTLAEKFGYSTSYMTSLFKKLMGENFMQYLISYRIEKATDMLLHTNKRIEQIASESGFGTYNNFARTFKKKAGVSPGEYRKKCTHGA